MGLFNFLFPEPTSDKPIKPKHMLTHRPMPQPTKESLTIRQLIIEIEHWQDRDQAIYKRHLEMLSDVCLVLSEAIESKK